MKLIIYAIVAAAVSIIAGMNVAKSAEQHHLIERQAVLIEQQAILIEQGKILIEQKRRLGECP